MISYFSSCLLWFPLPPPLFPFTYPSPFHEGFCPYSSCSSFSANSVYIRILEDLYADRQWRQFRTLLYSYKCMADHLMIARWRCGRRLAIGDCGFNPCRCTVMCDLGQVVRTHLTLPPSSRIGISINWAVNRHTEPHAGLLSMVLQLRLVSGCGLPIKSEISVALYMGQVSREDFSAFYLQIYIFTVQTIHRMQYFSVKEVRGFLARTQMPYRVIYQISGVWTPGNSFVDTPVTQMDRGRRRR